MRDMYHREGKTDLQKMRDDAVKMASGKYFGTPAVAVKIHHHPYEIVSDVDNTQQVVACADHFHEDFPVQVKSD